MPERLGQHFLTNPAVLRDIVDALDLRAGETVVEIGPGHGELTQVIGDRLTPLEISPARERAPEGPKGWAISNGVKVIEKAQKGAGKKSHIIAIEKDTQFVLALGKKFVNDPRVEIVRGDALDILPEFPTNYKLLTTPYKLVGNIPYYITGHLLRAIGELSWKPVLAVFTVQREVAERIVAEPPRMNRLAASIQFWADPHIVRIVSRTEFRPAPRVDSAVILLSTRPKNSWDVPADHYFALVRMLFAQPRKTVFNNLRGTGTTEKVASAAKNAGVSLSARPQDVSVKQIAILAQALLLG